MKRWAEIVDGYGDWIIGWLIMWLNDQGKHGRREVSWTLSKKLDTSAGPGEIKRREVSWTLTKKWDTFAGPGEIKRREVVLDPQVSPEEIKSREVELGLKIGLLLPQLFLNSSATDIVFVTVLHSSWDSSCVVY